MRHGKVLLPIQPGCGFSLLFTPRSHRKKRYKLSKRSWMTSLEISAHFTQIKSPKSWKPWSKIARNYFTFKGNRYRQITGLPIGKWYLCNACPSVHNKIESKSSPTALWLDYTNATLTAYILTVLILTTNKETDSEIFRKRNAIDTRIQFEIEQPDEDNSLSLLSNRHLWR